MRAPAPRRARGRVPELRSRSAQTPRRRRRRGGGAASPSRRFCRRPPAPRPGSQRSRSRGTCRTNALRCSRTRCKRDGGLPSPPGRVYGGGLTPNVTGPCRLSAVVQDGDKILAWPIYLRCSPRKGGRMRGRFGMSMTAAVGASAATASAVALFSVLSAHGAVARTGPLTVRAGATEPAGPYVRGKSLYDGKGSKDALGEEVSGALTGPLAPVAVASPDGKLLAYGSWRQLRAVDAQQSFSQQGIADGDAIGVPELRLHDDAGHDELLARGAYSAAWRSDGAIALVEGVEPEFRAGASYLGRVVFRRSARAKSVTWVSEPAHYVVYGWAGDRLIVYRIGLGEKLELLAVDAPGKVRRLTEGSAVALSPDETQLAVLDQEGANVRVLDVATGRERSWLDVTTASPALRWLACSGPGGGGPARLSRTALARVLGLVGRRPHRRAGERRACGPARGAVLAGARASTEPRR